jgi:hypothetical protein
MRVYAAPGPLRPLIPALILAAAVGLPAARAADEVDHSAHAGHAAGHAMSAADLATLRAKIPLYQSYTDEQVNASMARMRDTADYLSPPAVRHSVGVLALGHGYGDKGDAQFKAGFADVARSHPTAVGLGMAMMSSSHIQQAVADLEAAGATTIVVLPTEIGQRTNLTRQWNYILGREEVSAYLDVPRLKSRARVVMGTTPTGSPVVTDILAANLRTVSRDPAREFAVVIAHGPTDAQENAEELADLERHARGVQKALGLAGAMGATLQDDAPTAIREANVERIRERIRAEAAAGRRVLVAPLLVTSGGFVSMKIRRDLEGLDYTMVDAGLAESPLFPRWVDETVATLSGR